MLETDDLDTYLKSHDEPLFPGVRKFTAKHSSRAARILAIAGVVLILIDYGPSVWYTIRPGKLDISSLLTKTAEVPAGEVVGEKGRKSLYQPRYDASLPKENTISIPSIGIKTEIREATSENYEDALRKGVWRVPDFGTPMARGRPAIFTAHRYGYLKWSIPYRLKNSFFNLPKLKEGETVEIIWKQRKYVYEVYKEVKGEEITDYSANLILYTCESLDSPERIFRYARLLEI